MVEQRLQVLQVEQQQAFPVGHLEGGEQRGLLAIGQLQEVGQQQRAHLADGGAQRVAGLPGDVPERGRVGLRLVVQPRHAGDTFGDLALRVARRGDAAQVALMSAANTATPASLKDSARCCKVTVLPVPVAPAINP